MKRVFIAIICFIYLSLYNSEAQIVNASYVNPTNVAPGHKLFRFGNDMQYYAAFMWNNNTPAYGNGNDFSIFTYSNRDLVLQAFQGNIHMFPNSQPGKVGIGTTSDPTAALSIKGRSNNRILDGYNTVNNLMFQINSLSGYPHMDFYDIDGTTVDLKLSTNGNSFFNGGNLGIGNTNPTAKVHISDTESLGGLWNPALSYLTIAGFGSSLIMDSNEIYSDNSLNFGSSYAHDFTFRNVDTQGNQDLMVIKSNGFVGIGTTSPSSHLAVDGKITAQEVEITADGWADFVFEEDYDLPSLADVEAHIKTNKHLPGIPSASEVAENGINLGAMDALLLQKIEELTLYMIELKKENEGLEQENFEIKKAIAELSNR